MQPCGADSVQTCMFSKGYAEIFLKTYIHGGLVGWIFLKNQVFPSGKIFVQRTVLSMCTRRWAMCTRSLLRGGRYNALRICNCKLCLTSSLCARAFQNASDPSSRSYNKHLRLVSFALLLLFVQFHSDPNLEVRPLIMFLTDGSDA